MQPLLGNNYAPIGRTGANVRKEGWARLPEAIAAAIFTVDFTPGHPLFTPVRRDTELSTRLRARADFATYEARSDAALREFA